MASKYWPAFFLTASAAVNDSQITHYFCSIPQQQQKRLHLFAMIRRSARVEWTRHGCVIFSGRLSVQLGRLHIQYTAPSQSNTKGNSFGLKFRRYPYYALAWMTVYGNRRLLSVCAS